MVPKPEPQISLLLQPFIAFSVTMVFVAMLTAIHFDHYTLFQAHEIDDVRSYRSLPAKPVPVDLTQSQMLP
jgi:hypothetical protein